MAARRAVMKGTMLGNGSYGGRVTRFGGHGAAVRERAHMRGQPGRVALEHEQRDLVEHRVRRGRVERLALGPHDLLRGRRLLELVRVEQVLVELLARAPTDLLDGDVD